MFCKLKRWSKTSGFYLQPLNSFGEEEGKPLVEDPDNVSILPEVDRTFDFGEETGKFKVASYIMASESVQLQKQGDKRTVQTPEKKGEADKRGKTPKKAKKRWTKQLLPRARQLERRRHLQPRARQLKRRARRARRAKHLKRRARASANVLS